MSPLVEGVRYPSSRPMAEGPSGETFSLPLPACRRGKVSPRGPFGALVETTIVFICDRRAVAGELGLLLRQVARRVLLLRVVLGEIAADLAEPIGLDTIPVAFDLHMMRRVDRDLPHTMGDMLRLGIDADLALRCVDARLTRGDL